MRDLEEIANIAYNVGLQLHKELGPGLLESVYETIMEDMLVGQGLLSSDKKLFPSCFEDGISRKISELTLLLKSSY